VARCCRHACSAGMFCGLLGVLPLQLPDPRAIRSTAPRPLPGIDLGACFTHPRSRRPQARPAQAARWIGPSTCAKPSSSGLRARDWHGFGGEAGPTGWPAAAPPR
jgi:hypothetical protein